MRSRFVHWRMSFSENRFPPRIKSGAGFFRDMREMVRVVGFEPTASCVRGRHSRRAELHPVFELELALRREIESLSPDRQSGRLTRCVTEQIGASGSTRTSTECGLDAFPLPVGVQTRCCRMPDFALRATTGARHSTALPAEAMAKVGGGSGGTRTHEACAVA